MTSSENAYHFKGFGLLLLSVCLCPVLPVPVDSVCLCIQHSSLSCGALVMLNHSLSPLSIFSSLHFPLSLPLFSPFIYHSFYVFLSLSIIWCCFHSWAFLFLCWDWISCVNCLIVATFVRFIVVVPVAVKSLYKSYNEILIEVICVTLTLKLTSWRMQQFILIQLNW